MLTPVMSQRPVIGSILPLAAQYWMGVMLVFAKSIEKPYKNYSLLPSARASVFTPSSPAASFSAQRATVLLASMMLSSMSAARDEFREPMGYLTSLTALPYSSLRSGEYRGIIDVDRDGQLLWVMSVGHRNHVYDDFP
jgi:mRNA-degrading endonuclease RelE of RelBE toxin-antitoxin system